MKTTDLKKYALGEFSIHRLVRSFIIIYVFLLVLAWVYSDQLIFRPQPSSYTDHAHILKIEMENGLPISAAYFSNPNSEYTILYSHGNSVDLGDLYSFITTYQNLGVSLLSYDYPGYGTSPGTPTAKKATEAAEAALKYLTETLQTPLNRIIIHGRSAGGGPALALASHNQVAGVIAESTFVSAFRVLTRIPLTPFDKFKNLSRIDHVDSPVLIIHGRDDQTIPFWHGVKLFEKAREPKTNCWMDGATHNSIPPKSQKKYWESIASFITQLNSPES